MITGNNRLVDAKLIDTCVFDHRSPTSCAAGPMSAMNGFQVEHHNHVQSTPVPAPAAVVQRPMPVPQQSQQPMPMPNMNARPMLQQNQQQQQQQQQQYTAAMTSSAGAQRQIVSAVVHSDRYSFTFSFKTIKTSFFLRVYHVPQCFANQYHLRTRVFLHAG